MNRFIKKLFLKNNHSSFKSLIICFGIVGLGMYFMNTENVFADHSNESTHKVSHLLPRGNDLSEGLIQQFDFEADTIGSNTTVGIDSNYPGTLIGNHVKIIDSGDDVFGKVVNFGEGSGSYIKVNDLINTAKNSYTFTVWLKYDSSISEVNSNSSAVVFQQDGQGRSLLNIKANGQLNTYIAAVNIDSKEVIKKNEWVHIAISFNIEELTISYYINGLLDSVSPLSKNTVNQLTSLLIGSHKNLGNDPHQMRGNLDDIRIYNRALSHDEVQQIYNIKGQKIFIDNKLFPLLKIAKEVIKSERTNKLESDYQTLLKLVETIEGIKGDENIDVLRSYYNDLNSLIKKVQANDLVNISIDTSKIERKIDAKHIFGINHRYAFNGYGSFDEKEKKVRDEFVNLYKKAGFGSIRYPGGTISNLFNWKTAIGPVESRKKQIHGFYNNPGQVGIEANFGLSEIATFAQNVDSEMVYVYSLGRGNTQDVSDLMEFLNARIGTNPNGGVDWAQVRADLGHREPFNIKFFEIGNEMNQGGAGGDGTVSQSYWTAFVKGKNTEQAYTEGGTAIFNQQYVVDEENWNQSASKSSGNANMVKYMRYANVNPKKYIDDKIVDNPNFIAIEKDSVRVFVGDGKEKEEWEVVTNFNNSVQTSKHVVVDYSNGSIKFGDGIKGMIPKKGVPIRVSYSVQKDGYVQIAESLKRTMKQISETENTEKQAYVFSSYESPQFIKHMALLKKNHLYDGLTIHPYSGHVNGGNNPLTFYDNAMLKAENTGIKHVADYVKMLPEGKVPVISEYGIFRNTEPQVRSVTHALYIAKTLLEYVKLGSPYIQKHTLVDWYSSGGDSLGPTQQAVIQAVPQAGSDIKTGKGNYKYFATPSALVFEMLNKGGFGDNILKSSIEKSPKLENGVTSVSTLVSKDDVGNVYVALTNVNRVNSYDININFEGIDESMEGSVVEVKKLTSKNINDENSLTEPDKVHIENSEFTYTKGMTYTIPQHSFIILKFKVK